MKTRPLILSLLLASALLIACHTAATPPGSINANDPLTIIPDLAKAHSDKIQFAGFVTFPLLHSVDPAVKSFAQQMETDHKRLLARLADWAKKNKISTSYTYAPGLQGTALKSMEKMQGDLIESDNNAAFQHDYLILTWTDLDWQRNLLAAAIPQAKDPDLKAYLQDALDTQTKERETCRALLAKYKW